MIYYIFKSHANTIPCVTNTVQQWHLLQWSLLRSDHSVIWVRLPISVTSVRHWTSPVALTWGECGQCSFIPDICHEIPQKSRKAWSWFTRLYWHSVGLLDIFLYSGISSWLFHKHHSGSEQILLSPILQKGFTSCFPS